jgi:hypothetical protein
MLILSVGHPNAGRVLGAFEAAQMQRSTRAFVFSAIEPHRAARKAGDFRQTGASRRNHAARLLSGGG